MEILPHLWINYYTNNYSCIKEKKIKNIVHLSKISGMFKKLDVEEISIPLDYRDNQTIEEQNNIVYQHLDDVCNYIHEKIMINEKVLLLGYLEKQDIDIFIVAYLMKFGKYKMEDAILSLKTKKNNVFLPKCYFQIALQNFYNDCLNNSLF
jgi:hypothetical protein